MSFRNRERFKRLRTYCLLYLLLIIIASLFCSALQIDPGLWLFILTIPLYVLIFLCIASYEPDKSWIEKSENEANSILTKERDVKYCVSTPISVLRVYQDYCTITVSGKDVLQKGSKTFYYADLTSLQFREPDKNLNGFIQFEFPGAQSGSRIQNFLSENSFTFSVHVLPSMLEIYRFISQRIHEEKHSMRSVPGEHAPIVSTASHLAPLDELKKLKELLDLGAITQEEFDQKKKQLLGL